MRIRNDSIIAHSRIQAAKINFPSDARIKTNINEVDYDDILKKISSLQIQKYHYTPEWLAIRGIEDVEVRGVIAQQVREHFPEHVQVGPMAFEENEFFIEDFHEVDKQAITLDLLAAFNAHNRRFAVGSNIKGGGESISKSGKISVSSRNAAESGGVEIHSGSGLAGKSGNLDLYSAQGTAGSGGININTGI